MRTLTIAAFAALTATFAAAPAFASDYGYANHGHSNHGHSSYGHASYGHGQGHRYASSYGTHATYAAPSYQASSYHAPAYHAPVYVAPQPKTAYETRPAYVYQKVAGYCTDVVKSYGHNTYRKTVECKAGEAPAAAPVAPAPEVPAEPPK